MYIMGIKYDPREASKQEKKVRRSIEDVITEFTTETATIAAYKGLMPTEESFTLQLACNPSLYDLVDKVELTPDEKEILTNEAEIMSRKIRKLLPEIEGQSIKGK